MRNGGDLLKAYILSIAGAVLVSALVTLIAPSGKMGSFIKGACRTLILLVMLSPVVTLLSGGTPDADVSSVSFDEEYLAYCARRLSEGDEEAIAAHLISEHGVTARAQVTRSTSDLFSVKKIEVEITDFGINAQDEHIHIIEEIAAELEARYGCSVLIA